MQMSKTRQKYEQLSPSGAQSVTKKKQNPQRQGTACRDEGRSEEKAAACKSSLSEEFFSSERTGQIYQGECVFRRTALG